MLMHWEKCHAQFCDEAGDERTCSLMWDHIKEQVCIIRHEVRRVHTLKTWVQSQLGGVCPCISSSHNVSFINCPSVVTFCHCFMQQKSSLRERE